MIITFDAYGTLLDTDPFYQKINFFANQNGYDGEKFVQTFNFQRARVQYGEHYQDYSQVLTKALRLVDIYYDTNGFLDHHREAIFGALQSLKPFSDVLPALKALKSAGNSLYIISNTDHQLAQYQLSALDSLMDGIITAEDARAYKPQPGLFELAQRQLNLTEHNHLHVARGYWADIFPASQFNWPSVWINRGHMSNSQMYPHDMTLADLTLLPDYVQNRYQ